MVNLGSIGPAIGGAVTLRGQLEIAAAALQKFAGFVICEVVRPAQIPPK
jgi:hypothetical protein